MMSLSRGEINLRRLLTKCELMAKGNQKDDSRFPRYVESLEEMVKNLLAHSSKDNIRTYCRRIANLKSSLGMPVSDGSDDFVLRMSREEHEKGARMREELLGARRRSANREGSGDVDELLNYHESVQERIADDMLSLTRNLKEQSELANRIIKNDTEVVSRSQNLTERNHSKLKVETGKLAEHSKRAWKCWMWLMLLVVLIVFINMVLFMKVMKKRA